MTDQPTNGPAKAPEQALTLSLRHEQASRVPEVGSAQTISSTGHAGLRALKAWREAGGRSGPRRTPVERLTDNPRSLRLAVNAKCWDCLGGDADPGIVRRIRECGCTTCPLHAVRPHQHHADTGSDQ